MFINFSNHPYALWSAEQQAAAQRALHYDSLGGWR